MKDETVLVTGASSGIGLHLARRFAADGSDLALVARSEDKLQDLAGTLREQHGISVHVLAKDLTRPEAPQELFDVLAAENVAVDVLVNNAGFGARGTVAELDVERQIGMIQLNVTALTHLTRLFLPAMLERRRGGILNVGSTAGFQPGPNMSVYYATKAYVLSFTEGLAEEVAGTGVAVTCLAPGATDTGFAEEADMEGTRLFQLGTMTSEAVAEAGFQGFRAGKTLVIPGLKNKASAFSVRFAPRAAVRKIVKSLQS